MFAVHILSFTPTKTPAKGPNRSFLAILPSISSASRRTVSETVMKLLIFGSVSRSRVRASSASSTAVVWRLRRLWRVVRIWDWGGAKVGSVEAVRVCGVEERKRRRFREKGRHCRRKKPGFWTVESI